MPDRRLLVVAGLVILTFGSLAYAQRIFVGGGRGAASRPRFATEADFDGSFIYCRGFFRSVRREPSGSGWGTDYPGADNNFSIRLAELTRVQVKWEPDRQPVHVVVRLSDPLLFNCPVLVMEDVGTIGFSEDEVVNLRNYLLKGGFLWVDDFWGTPAWDCVVPRVLASASARRVSDRRHPDFAPDHALGVRREGIPAGLQYWLLEAKRWEDVRTRP